jgi:hypothetical protein
MEGSMFAHRAIVSLITLALAASFTAPAARAQDENGAAATPVPMTEAGVPYVVADFIADMRRDEVGESIYSKSPQETAVILLDLLLSEEPTQILISEQNLRMDYERAASLMHSEIAQAFTDALAGDIKSRAKAMLWADGLMRVAPFKSDAPAHRIGWELTSREGLAKALYSKYDDEGLYQLYYDFAEQQTGLTLRQKVSDESAKAFDERDPVGWYEIGSLSLYSEETFAELFWTNAYIITLYREDFEKHLKLASAIDYFRSPYALNRFLSGEEYFRPMFALQVFLPFAQGKVRKRMEHFPLLADTTLQIWGIWLEQQDAAAKPASE